MLAPVPVNELQEVAAARSPATDPPPWQTLASPGDYNAIVSRSPGSAAVVEGASLEAVRRALGDVASEDWLHVQPGPAGVRITATGGPLGPQAWDVAEALPSATAYFRGLVGSSPTPHDPVS